MEAQVEPQGGLYRIHRAGQILADFLGFENRQIGAVELELLAHACQGRLCPGGYTQRERAREPTKTNARATARGLTRTDL